MIEIRSIFAFKLVPNDLGEGYMDLVHQGNVGGYARFAEATRETICTLAYCECSELLMIAQSREVRNI